MKTISTHYIDGAFVDSHGREVADSINPTNGKVTLELGGKSPARRVVSRILAGRVVINGMTDDPQAPWGGFKHSGVGREYGAFGIEASLEPRAIIEVLTTAA